MGSGLGGCAHCLDKHRAGRLEWGALVPSDRDLDRLGGRVDRAQCEAGAEVVLAGDQGDTQAAFHGSSQARPAVEFTDDRGRDVGVPEHATQVPSVVRILVAMVDEQALAAELVERERALGGRCGDYGKLPGEASQGEPCDGGIVRRIRDRDD